MRIETFKYCFEMQGIVKKYVLYYFRQTDGQTDKQTDQQMDRQIY